MCIKNYLWITPFISFICGYLLLRTLFQPKEFDAPAIIGKQLLTAVSILSDHALNIRFLAQKEEPDLPQGTILAQKPLPGRKIKANQAVYVVISKKSPKIPCPDLLGKSLDTIIHDLEKENIRNKSYFFPSNYPRNSCIAQYPCPRIALKENNIITYLSNGNKKPVIFPDFKGKKIDTVIEFLKKYEPQIRIEMVHSFHDNTEYLSKEDHIISDQRPLAGSIITLDEKNPISVHLKVVGKQNYNQSLA